MDPRPTPPAAARGHALTTDPHAPVVVRFPALGDAVLLTPLLDALARRHGRPVHLLASGPWTEALLGHDRAVGELRLVSSRRAPYWLTPSQWSAVRWLRAHRGPVYFCERDEASAALVARAGVPPGRLVRAWDDDPGTRHWADWWLQVAARNAPDCPLPAAAVPTPPTPRLQVPPAWHADTARWLQQQGLADRPLVLLQPGHKKTHKRGRLATASHDKHWPTAHWAAVAAGILAALPQAVVLVCGSPREHGLAQAVVDAALALAGPAARTRGAVRNLAADCPLPRLAGLAARAHSMVSVDTGPAHVAGAMDCPLVVLYGRFGWQRWLPRTASAPVRPLGPRLPQDDARLLDISPAQVLDAWRTLGDRGVAASPAPAPVAPPVAVAA